MKVRLRCPACHQAVRVPSDLGTLKISCPACRRVWEESAERLRSTEVAEEESAFGGMAGWQDLRKILAIVAPFAAFVGTATLVWSIFQEVLWSAAAGGVCAIITAATLFCDPRSVRTTWGMALLLVVGLWFFAIIAGILYYTIGGLLAALSWVGVLLVKQPFVFACGVAVAFVAAIGFWANRIAKTGVGKTLRPACSARHSRQEKDEKTERSQGQTPRKSVAYVYLMENTRNGYFKIGWSKDPTYREKTLQSEEPEVLLRWKIEGTPEDERFLHKKFSRKRVRGEWFSLSKSDVDWMRSSVTVFDLYRS